MDCNVKELTQEFLQTEHDLGATPQVGIQGFDLWADGPGFGEYFNEP